MKRKLKKTFSDGYDDALRDYEKNPNLYKLKREFVFSVKGFWYNNPKMPTCYDLWGNKEKNNDYKIIVTRYDKGYKAALEDLEKYEKGEGMKPQL